MGSGGITSDRHDLWISGSLEWGNHCRQTRYLDLSSGGITADRHDLWISWISRVGESLPTDTISGFLGSLEWGNHCRQTRSLDFLGLSSGGITADRHDLCISWVSRVGESLPTDTISGFLG